MPVRSLLAILVLALTAPTSLQATTLDLATVAPGAPGVLRLHGSTGNGVFGVPVAGGADVDGDGHVDAAMAAMIANPNRVDRAGIVYLLFGDGTVGATLDSAAPGGRILEIHGVAPQENAGNEIWIDDVTGDGLGDVIVGRQNFGTSIPRAGLGAISIVVGSPALRGLAAAATPLVLDAPPAGVQIFSIVGAQVFGRLGIWMRTGDVDGDAIADLAVGADQEMHDRARHAGAVYLVRGGPHLAATATVVLDGFDPAASDPHPLRGHLARIVPPGGSTEFHLGATCQLADLDGNGRAEVLGAAALNRAGATLLARGGEPGSAHAIGGGPDGILYIAWDENFPATPWDESQWFRIDESPGARTTVRGARGNETFGEEIIGGDDYDGDGRADLFVGDIVGDLTPGRIRPTSGAGYVLYDAASLRGRTIDLETPPADLVLTTIVGAAAGDIAADTAAQGDFDGDGRPDLAFSAPHHAPFGRIEAGAVYVFFGQVGPWPERIDLALPLPTAGLRATVVFGARGTSGSDTGDTLAYSAAAGDLNGDGRSELITNEMEGNGLAPDSADVGNLLVLDGALLAGQEAGAICPPRPRVGCKTALPRRATLRLRSAAVPERARLDWRWTRGEATTLDDLGDPMLAGTGYALCLYDGSADVQPRLSLRTPAEPDCAGGGCWRTAGRRGFRYRQQEGLPDGVQRASLRSGGAGRSSLQVRSRGRGVLPDGMPLELPVTVQWLRDDAPDCWGVTYLESLRNQADRFVARGP